MGSLMAWQISLYLLELCDQAECSDWLLCPANKAVILTCRVLVAAASSLHRQASARRASTVEESGTQQGPWGTQMPSYQPSTEALKGPNMHYMVTLDGNTDSVAPWRRSWGFMWPA